MAKLLLAGYFGCGNLGDDAILHAFLANLDGFDARDITVLSGSPEQTYTAYRVRSIPRKEMKMVKEAIKECDVLVFPGGSIFQDVTSVWSAFYYRELVVQAHKAKKRVVMLGQGVGPLEKFLSRSAAVQAFNLCDAIAVRDPESMSLLRSLGVRRSIELSADLALLLPKPIEKESGFQIGNMKAVGLSPRPWGKDDRVPKLFGEVARELFTAGYMPVFLEMDREEDGPLIREISRLQGGRIPDMTKLASPEDVQERMMRMEGILAMRLHAGILATTVGVPAFMLSYDPKVSAFAKLMQMQAANIATTSDPVQLAKQFISFLKNKEANQRVLNHQHKDLIPLARKNMEVLKQVLDKGAVRR